MSLGNHSRVWSPSQFTHMLKWNILYFILFPLLLVHSLDTNEKGLTLCFLLPGPSVIYAHWQDPPEPSLVQSKQSFDGLITVCKFLFCPGEFRTGHNTPAGSHQCWGGGFPLLTCCWCCSQRLPLLWGPITASWSPWHPTGNPGSFLPRYFSMCCSPTWSTGMFLPMSSLGIFLLLKCMRFLFAHFCRLSGFPLNDGTTIWSVNCSFLFCVICKYADAIHRFRGVS